MAQFTLSSLTLRDASGRTRLHSRAYTLYVRSFALLLGCGGLFSFEQAAPFAPSSDWGTLTKGALLALATLAVAWFIWSCPKRVFATPDGLEVRAGKKTRLIPWPRVLDVRELPWIRYTWSFYPRMWQVDLDHDERFDFCGTRRAREIVKEYIERHERHAFQASHR
jgi:hypothetical protein